MQLFVATAFALLIADTVTVHRVLFCRVGLWPAAAWPPITAFARFRERGE